MHPAADRSRDLDQSEPMDETPLSHAQIALWLDRVSVSEDIFALCPDYCVGPW